MGWSPSNRLLGTVNEQEDIDFNITYQNDVTNEFEPVTISANTSDPTISLLPGRITGQYTEVFDNIIRYRTTNDELIQVDRWNEIDRDIYYGIYYYQADGTIKKTYTYTATSTTSSKTYTVDIENDWSLELSTVAQYAAIEHPKTGSVNALPPSLEIIPGEVVVWVNSNNRVIAWLNNNNRTLLWKNSYGNS